MKKSISIGAALIAVAVVLLYVPRALEAPQTISVPTSTTTQFVTAVPAPAATASVATSATNATLIVGAVSYPIAVSSDETVIDAMNTLMADRTLTFTGRDYPGLGFFVDSINGERNAGGKYWILYVNGVSASAGASATMLRTGDTVEWRYEQGY